MHLDYKNPPKLPRSVLKDLLLFATKKSHFVFDGQYHEKSTKHFYHRKDIDPQLEWLKRYPNHIKQLCPVRHNLKLFISLQTAMRRLESYN